MTRISIAAIAVATLLTSACSSTEKLAAQQPYDMQLSCAQIQNEFAQTDAVMDEARKNKGVSGANVAAFLVFWPAIIGNYMDAEKGEDLAMVRRQNLTYLANRQGCNMRAPQFAGYGQPVQRGYMANGLRR